MSAPLIRNATPADLPAITDIYAHAVINGTASYEYDPPSLEEMTRRYDALVAANYPYIVVEDQRGDERRVRGYAYAGAFRTRAAYRFMVEDSIYIAPDAQGQGLGKLLLTELIQRCTSLGFRQMLAIIGDAAVNTGSVKLHESLGFTQAGRIVA
jgi:phosphinothricin acetyltransferase